MANCHEMKKGEIYICEDCGLKIQVVQECKDVGKSVDSCDCHSNEETCSIECCGKPLVRKVA